MKKAPAALAAEGRFHRDTAHGDHSRLSTSIDGLRSLEEMVQAPGRPKPHTIWNQIWNQASRPAASAKEVST
jgi:hypothetical protein